MKFLSLATVALLGAVSAVSLRRQIYTPIDALQLTQVDVKGDYGCDDHDD